MKSFLQGRRRVHHRKVRTGCITCKYVYRQYKKARIRYHWEFSNLTVHGPRVRKIRCDEGKPACDRCTTTGRSCEGYMEPRIQGTSSEAIQATAQLEDISGPASSQISENPSSSAGRSTPPNTTLRCARGPTVGPRLALPRNNTNEVRSYRFFLEAAAPSLLGCFDVDFWLRDLPRACHADRAVWHAVISLGAAYEASSYWKTTSADIKPKTAFALQQFNVAIQCMTSHLSTGAGLLEQRRALTISLIFTYICSIQGLHEQARIHLNAGCHLLRELEQRDCAALKRESKKSTSRNATASTSVDYAHPGFPIALAPLRSALSTLQTQAIAFDNGNLSGASGIIVHNDSYNVWRSYSAPCRAEDLGNRSPKQLAQHITAENLACANRAVESLLNALAYFAQLHATDIQPLATGQGVAVDVLERLISRQGAHTRCLQELSVAIRLFDLFKQQSQAFSKKALLSLKMFHTAARLLLCTDPEIPDPARRVVELPRQFWDIIGLAEEMLDLDPEGGPVPSPTQPLFVVVQSGYPQPTRRRAAALLRRSRRCKGLWDSRFAAELADAILAREQDAIREALGTADQSGKGQDADAEVGFIDRIMRIPADFVGNSAAIIRPMTWREHFDGRQAAKVLLNW